MTQARQPGTEQGLLLGFLGTMYLHQKPDDSSQRRLNVERHAGLLRMIATLDRHAALAASSQQADGKG
jgi:hypothetical protein